MPKSKPRIATVSLRSGNAIEITEKQKSSIERAYGHGLEPSVWKKIVATTSLFTILGPSEYENAPLRVIIKKVADLNRAAKLLQIDFSSREVITPPDLGGLVKKYFEEASLDTGPADLLEVLAHCVEATIAVTAFALEHLAVSKDTAHQHLEPGTFWRIWVINLTWILDDAGLPTGAAKDRAIRKDGSSSDFVRFISEMQRHLPPLLRRHMPSPTSTDDTIYLDALAQGISRARKRSPRVGSSLLVDALAKLLLPPVPENKRVK